MNRREFLKAIALTGAGIVIKPGDTMDLMAQNVSGSSTTDLVAVMGGEPEVMFRKAIAEMGGMKKFVKAGAVVAIKPNIGWDVTPELGGNTNPKLVAEIVKQCLAAGAKEVQVFDHTCDEWVKTYRTSGIKEAG
ncbi:MAG: DUF362 domain-containing protein, partial [Alistipes sp.]|nr:DUF362 domain-containing protein [Alistipes sp.]